MTHFGLLCPATIGHLNPMIALGRELQQRGHQVTLFSILDTQHRVEQSGLNFWPLGQTDYPLGISTELKTKLGQLHGWATARYTADLMRKAAAMVLEEGPQAFQAAGVDALLVDQVYPAGGTIADALGLPFVTICAALLLNQEPSIPPFFTPWRYQSHPLAILRNRIGYALINRISAPTFNLINQYRQAWHLSPLTHPDQAYSSLAQLSQLPAALDYPRTQLPNCFHYTGPYASHREPVPFPYDQLNGKPLIYASVGTLQNRLRHIFEDMATACAAFECQLVLSLGRGIDPQTLADLPGDPIVVAYAPQLELLQQAALAITHAGSGTILDALTSGVPLVAVPIATDQPATAARLAWAGAGRVIPLRRLKVSRLQTAIAAVLTESTYRHQAHWVQQSIYAAGGVDRAVAIIEQAVTTRQPVLTPYRPATQIPMEPTVHRT